MKIGLIDVDGHNFPNLALMKISAWHKAQGDSVEWWNGFIHYDRVYMSKVFTFTPDVDTVIAADEVIRGGTGYKDYGSLPPEIEKTYPDYSIYPDFNAAIGFLTRGCIRNCPWCIVPRKEGHIRPAATRLECELEELRSFKQQYETHREIMEVLHNHRIYSRGGGYAKELDKALSRRCPEDVARIAEDMERITNRLKRMA